MHLSPTHPPKHTLLPKHTFLLASTPLIEQFRDSLTTQCGWPSSFRRTERLSSLCAVCWGIEQAVHASHLGLWVWKWSKLMHMNYIPNTQTSLMCRKCLILSPPSFRVSRKPSLRTKSPICSLFQCCLFTICVTSLSCLHCDSCCKCENACTWGGSASGFFRLEGWEDRRIGGGVDWWKEEGLYSSTSSDTLLLVWKR